MFQKPREIFRGENGYCGREGKYEKAGRRALDSANGRSLMTVETAVPLGLNPNARNSELAITETDRGLCLFSNHLPIKVKADDHVQL